MKKIAVIYGGFSPEREVSLSTGTSIIEALREFNDYTIYPYELTKDIYALMDFLKTTQPDVVFNALHGKFGEDGHIQALLNGLRIPYTHSGMKASCLAFDKALTLDICRKSGINVADSFETFGGEIHNHLPFDKDKVIKPTCDGSSVGIFIIPAGTTNLEHMDLSAWNNSPFLVEDYIKGREFSVSVDENGAKTITEIITSHTFYDYSAKYDAGGSQHIIPADLPQAVYQAILDAATKLYQKLGCRGIARADFMYDGDKFYVLEMNTQPGMTPTSLMPEQKLHEGISYANLCRMMVESAKVD